MTDIRELERQERLRMLPFTVALVLLATITAGVAGQLKYEQVQQLWMKSTLTR